MRWPLAVLLCVLAATIPAAGSKAAAKPSSRLSGFVVGDLRMLNIASTVRPPQLVQRGEGLLVIETYAPVAPETTAALAKLQPLLATSRIDGSRLRLTLAPGVASSIEHLKDGQLSLALERPPLARSTPPASPQPATAPPVNAAVASARPIPATQAPPREPARAMPLPKPRPLFEPEGTPSPLPAPEAGPVAPAVTAEASGKGAEIRFTFGEPVRAAVFRRAGMLWAIFDRPATEIDGWTKLGRGPAGGWIEPVAQEGLDGAQLFRLALRREAEIEARADGGTWRLRLSPPSAEEASRPAAVGLVRDLAGGLLRGPAGTRAVTLDDPDTGERLGVLLAPAGVLRQPVATRLVDLELLAAPQGLAWRALTDGVAVTADGQGFTLGRPGGLRLSSAGSAPEPETDPEPHGALPPGEAPVVATLPGQPVEAPPAHAANGSSIDLPTAALALRSLGASTPAIRQQARAKLNGTLGSLTPLPQAVERLNLARLFLADGLGQEAQATLRRIDPSLLPEEVVATVRSSRDALAGAASALEGRSEAASKALAAPGLARDSEAALWRSYAAARAGRHVVAASEWSRGGKELAGYPMPLRLTLGLEVAHSLAQNGDPQQARALLELLQPLATDRETKAKLQLLRGLAAARRRQPLVSEQALLAAAEEGDADTRVKAAFLLTMARHQQGAVDSAGAAKQLELQRSLWRGHAWEDRMLRQLGELQAKAGDRMGALTTATRAAGRPNDAPTVEAATDDARRRLKELLQAALAGEVPLSAALAVHGTLGDLLDGDPQASDLLRQLALRAAEAGYPAASAGLLERARAGAADATRDELTHALTKGDDVPAGIAAAGAAGARPPEEALALTRASSALKAGDAKAALAALGKLAGVEAERLRLQASITVGDWKAVRRAAEAIVARRRDQPMLDEEGATALVWQALARARLGEPATAALLSARNEKRLPDGPWRPLLALIASTALEAGTSEEVPVIAGSLANAVRKQLELLPQVESPAAADLKSADARSAPQ